MELVVKVFFSGKAKCDFAAESREEECMMKKELVMCVCVSLFHTCFDVGLLSQLTLI